MKDITAEVVDVSQISTVLYQILYERNVAAVDGVKQCCSSLSIFSIDRQPGHLQKFPHHRKSVPFCCETESASVQCYAMSTEHAQCLHIAIYSDIIHRTCTLKICGQAHLRLPRQFNQQLQDFGPSE